MAEENKTLKLCDQCKCCPTVRREGEKFILTDDENGKVVLTALQFQTLVDHGHELLDPA